MKPKLIMLVGPAGSGKSTWCKQHPNINRISQDDQGKNHLALFNDCLINGHDIIVDRMNFDKKQRNRYIEPARAAGYEIEIVVFHVPRQVCFDRMMKRENHPTINGISTAIKNHDKICSPCETLGDFLPPDINIKANQANSALDIFFTKYERVEDSEADKVTRLGWDGEKETAVICDLDGTLCNIDHRLQHVKHENKKNNRWDLFNKLIPFDTINKWCDDIIGNIHQHTEHSIILCSGRVDSSRRDTESWLELNQVEYRNLFMRHRADFRQDYIIKEVILDFEILPRYNVLFAIDDRNQVCEMWRRRGIVCLQCTGDGDF